MTNLQQKLGTFFNEVKQNLPHFRQELPGMGLTALYTGIAYGVLNSFYQLSPIEILAVFLGSKIAADVTNGLVQNGFNYFKNKDFKGDLLELGILVGFYGLYSEGKDYVLNLLDQANGIGQAAIAAGIGLANSLSAELVRRPGLYVFEKTTELGSKLTGLVSKGLQSVSNAANYINRHTN